LLRRDDLDGRAHLKPEHLAVFDCANPCGRNGTAVSRSKPHHDDGGGAAFFTGAISKTITWRISGDGRGLQGAYMLSWRLGLKATRSIVTAQAVAAFGLDRWRG